MLHDGKALVQQKNVKRHLYLETNYILQTEIAMHRLGRKDTLITRARLMHLVIGMLLI